jgi:hypothetical protein
MIILPVPGVAEVLLVSGLALLIALAAIALVTLAFEAYAQRGRQVAAEPRLPRLHIPHTVPLDWMRANTRALRH